MAWKVKKEMPMGSSMTGIMNWKPSRFRLVSTNTRYLNTKKMDMLKTLSLIHI